MLGRYILVNHLKAFLLISAVLYSILYLYLAGEVLFVFKEKGAEVFLSYTLNFLPVAFFYSSAFVNALAVLFFFRRLFQKKIDLLVQSFGIAPIRLFLWVFIFSGFLSLLSVAGSHRLFPESQKRLFQIEKEHKKAKQVESGIVRNLWLTYQENSWLNFYNFELVDLSTGRVYGFYMLKVKDGSIRYMATGSHGTWYKNRLEIPQASLIDLTTGEEKLERLSLTFFELSQIKPLAEKPEHLSVADLLLLSLTGKDIGINYRQYAYELARRLFTSLLPLSLSIVVSWTYVRWRQLKLGFVALISVFSFHWLLLNLMRSFVENTNLNLSLIFSLYIPIPLLTLKALYDLSKGFRV